MPSPATMKSLITTDPGFLGRSGDVPMRAFAAAVLLISLTVPAGARAQVGPLIGDRPDFTESAATVGLGVVQIEFGYTLERDATRMGGQDLTVSTHSLGEVLVRTGILAEWLELRVGLNPLVEEVRRDGDTDRVSGVEDLQVGFKVTLREQQGLTPAIAVLPLLTLPTGSQAFTNDQARPTVNTVLAWDLSDVVSLSSGTAVSWGETEVARETDVVDISDYLEVAQSLVMAHSLSDRTGMYVEWFAFFHSEFPTRHYVNGGLTWALGDDLQWDIRIGSGLNEAAGDIFTGTGLVVRLH